MICLNHWKIREKDIWNDPDVLYGVGLYVVKWLTLSVKDLGESIS